ncbi:flagellar motor switch protein FliM [Methyloglobulus morosus KoM1]|uniref:Flagellar motor switch protein FliM n=1 Tax=Methyloglobulus morosus KoM1 TaxID=1116472 RepID=V5C983_9GAMM|nr:flagellar motor switch protein FliM [Methyloglobulus morosus]ESS73338.1 flagellar motor switch protein FliM [Methyloglobulus morosus KoM1]
MSDLLSQEEINALLQGMDDGEIETEVENFEDKSSAKEYDFSSQERIVRRRIPTLEMINERFSKSLRTSLFKFLHRSPEIFMSGIQIRKFSEYVDGLHVPANLNIIRYSPLRGRAIIEMEPSLIFAVVDNFFGGGGQFYGTSGEAREFTLTEMRIVQMLLDMMFKNLKEAWKPVMELNFEYLGSEINPSFASIVGAEDIVMISAINVALESGGGDIKIVMPYSMIEPIRGLLDTIGDDSDESDLRWKNALRNEVLRASVPVNGFLVEKKISIGDVLRFKKGDVIPIDMPKTMLLKASGVPIYSGKACVSEGYYAMQVIDRVKLR